MTRGRPPQKALDDALPIAKTRGAILQFKEEDVFECDLLILSAERFSVIRIKRTRHLWCTPEGMEAQFIEPVTRLRRIPASAFVSRELWVWSQYGTWRFFRVEDAGIVEIDRDGKNLIPPGPGPVAAKLQGQVNSRG
jgi:hypothetical protein